MEHKLFYYLKEDKFVCNDISTLVDVVTDIQSIKNYSTAKELWNAVVKLINDNEMVLTENVLRSILTDKRVTRLDTRLRIVNEFLAEIVYQVMSYYSQGEKVS